MLDESAESKEQLLPIDVFRVPHINYLQFYRYMYTTTVPEHKDNVVRVYRTYMHVDSSTFERSYVKRHMA